MPKRGAPTSDASAKRPEKKTRTSSENSEYTNRDILAKRLPMYDQVDYRWLDEINRLELTPAPDSDFQRSRKCGMKECKRTGIGTFLLIPHHCRLCARTVCGACSGGKFEFKQGALRGAKDKRICDECKSSLEKAKTTTFVGIAKNQNSAKKSKLFHSTKRHSKKLCTGLMKWWESVGGVTMLRVPKEQAEADGYKRCSKCFE